MASTAPTLELRAVWLLFAALCLHNLEEALTFNAYYERSTELAERLLGAPVTLPPPTQFLIALGIVTTLGALVAIWASQPNGTALKRRAVAGFALILLANVLLPHAPAAIMMGGYAPGVVTAVLINLPLSLYVLRRLAAQNAPPHL